MRLARRISEIQPFHVMEVMAHAQTRETAGHDIVHMEVGEPDFPTPEPIVEAARRFLAQGHVHYTHALGIAPLREAIAQWYAIRHGITLDPARVVVTAGASAALLIALGILTNPGDEWLLPDPGYPCNRHFVRFCEARARALAVDAATNYQPTAEQAANAWSSKTRGLLIASPANPTGTLLTLDEIRVLEKTVRERGGILIVDEIYHGLTYGRDVQTALAISDEIIVLNSFSKYFGMTGWRLGWLILPPALVRAAEKLAQNLYICPSTVAQHAALAAFSPETIAILEARRQTFAARRDRLLAGLRSLGFGIPAEPHGAFYVYADVSPFTHDSMQFSLSLLEHANVAITPGHDFGTNAPERHVRFAYTVGEERLQEGLERIERFLSRSSPRP